MTDFLYSRLSKTHQRKESRSDKRKRAVKDIRDLLELGQPLKMVIEAIYTDYQYSPASIYNLIKEAELQIAIAQRNKNVGGSF